MDRGQLEDAIRELNRHQDATFALYKKHKMGSPLDMFYGRQSNEQTAMRIALEGQLARLDDK